MQRRRHRRIGATHCYIVVVHADGTQTRNMFAVPIRMKNWFAEAARFRAQQHSPKSFVYVVTFKVK